MIIAVDGPAASGKGTLARRLAAHFELAHLDTGLIYRAVGKSILAENGNPEDPATAIRAAERLEFGDLARPGLRDEPTGVAASKVAAIAVVRARLLIFQRHFANHPPAGCHGAVLDGRDIGTVVCPGAPVKLFLRANPEERARRRVKELQDRGLEAIHSRILRDMEERDQRDRSRPVAPLEPAKDALVLDTSSLDADAVFTAALDYIASREYYLTVWGGLY